MSKAFETYEVFEGGKTWEEYYAQFPSAVPILGGRYVQHPGTWEERYWTIIFMNEDVALGQSINPFDKKLVEYDLFRVRGYAIGWRVNDPRPNYRLQNVS